MLSIVCLKDSSLSFNVAIPATIILPPYSPCVTLISLVQTVYATSRGNSTRVAVPCTGASLDRRSNVFHPPCQRVPRGLPCSLYQPQFQGLPVSPPISSVMP